MDKTYRFLTRREANLLADAGVNVEWRYNRSRYWASHKEEDMVPWSPWIVDRGLSLYTPIEGYDDQFRVEVE